MTGLFVDAKGRLIYFDIYNRIQCYFVKYKSMIDFSVLSNSDVGVPKCTFVKKLIWMVSPKNSIISLEGVCFG